MTNSKERCIITLYLQKDRQLTIRARDSRYWKVDDFYSGQEIDTPGKKALWQAAMNLRGGPSCTLRVFEEKGRSGLHLRGIKEFLKNNIDPDDLAAEAALRNSKNISSAEKQKILLSNMVSNLSNQFRTKFVPIYQMMTNTNGPIIDGGAFPELHDHFKTSSATTEVTADKERAYKIIGDVYKCDKATIDFIRDLLR